MVEIRCCASAGMMPRLTDPPPMDALCILIGGYLLWRSPERPPWNDVVTTCPSIGQTDDSPDRRSPLAGTRI